MTKKTTGCRCSVSSALRTWHCSVLSSHMPAANSDKKKEHLLLTRGPHRCGGTDVASGLAAAVGRAAGLQGCATRHDRPLSCHQQRMTAASSPFQCCCEDTVRQRESTLEESRARCEVCSTGEFKGQSLIFAVLS